MRLRRLRLDNFRNLPRAEIFPDPGFNILWGENAQGKTNTLEAIYLLGHLKSFRAPRNQELVGPQGERARLETEFEAGGVRRRAVLDIAGTGKTFYLDGKRPGSAEAFAGHLRPVLFAPEEVALARGNPAGRRALLDRAVFQADPGYLTRAREYEKHLRQRNRLLREGCTEATLAPWTEGVIRTGAAQRRERRAYLDRLAERFCQAYREISGGREEAQVHYSPGEGELQELEEGLRQQLRRHAGRERELGQTLAGPHRDDLDFTVGERPVRRFGSQGQQRSVILAFKTAQILDLEDRTGEPPVLLLDDMTSELDRRRQRFFFEFILARSGQVFITTTDLEFLVRQGMHSGSCFQVENGLLHQEG